MSSTTETKRAADVAKLQADQAAADAKRAEQEAQVQAANDRFRSAGSTHYFIGLTENLGIGDTVNKGSTVRLNENLGVAATVQKYQAVSKDYSTVKQEKALTTQSIAQLQTQRETERATLKAQLEAVQTGPQHNYSQMLQEEALTKQLNTLDTRYNAMISEQQQKLSALSGAEKQLQQQRYQTVTQKQVPNYANPDYAKPGSPEYLGQTEKKLNQPKWTETQKHIETGDTTRLYGKEGFVQHPLLQDAEKGKESTAYTVSLTEGGANAPKNYAVSLSEGRPPTPKNYTQEQVNKLSPQEYAVYQAEYAAYNQYVNQKNAEIKKENRLSLKGYQTKVLSIIEKAKAEGATGIRITDEQGNIIKTTPLSRAFYDISKLKSQNIFLIPAGEPERQLTGVSQSKEGVISQTYTEGERFRTGLFIPEYKVTKTGEVETKTPITDWTKAVEQSKQEETYRAKDPFSVALRQADVMEKSSHRDVKIASSVISNIGSQFAGLVNLSNLAGRTLAEKLTGKTPLGQDIVVPESAPGSFFDVGIFGGAEQAIRTKNPKAFPSRLAEAGSAYYKSLEKDPYRTLAETGGFLTPILPIPTPGIAQAKTFVGKISGFLKGAKPMVSFKTIEEPLIQVRYRPTNPMRESAGMIKESVRMDTATPFQKEYVNLGRSHAVVAGERIPARNALGGEMTREVKPKVEGGIKPRQPEPDAFYKPKVDVRRAPEPNTYRSDDRITFAWDTATSFEKQTVSLGEGKVRRERVEQARNALGGVITKAAGEIPFSSEPIRLGEGSVISKRQTVPLGAGIGKRITPKFGVERIELGEGKQVIKRQSVGLGAGTTKRIMGRFESQNVPLGEGKKIYQKQSVGLGIGETKRAVRIQDEIIETRLKQREKNIPRTVKEDPFYKPYLEKRRAAEIGKYQIEKTKLFKADTTTSVSLGRAKGRTGFAEKSRGPLAEQEGTIIKYTDEIEGNVKALSKKQPKTGRENQYKPIARKDEGVPSGKGTVQILKPEPKPKGGSAITESVPEKGGGFTKTTVGLGEGKGIVIATGGIAAAPLPLLVRGEDQGQPITNGTQTNGTEIILPESDVTSTVSILEPASITETRPSTKGAILSGTGYDLYSGVKPITRTGLGLGTRSEIQTEQKQKLRQPIILSYAEVTGLRQPQKEKQRTATPFPEPTRQPQRLEQPEAFKEREKLKLKTPEKIPKKIPQQLIIPFSEKKKKQEKRQKEEAKDTTPFIGNVFEEQVTGGFRGFDVKYGQKQVSRQSALGISISRKGKRSFVESRNESFLGKKQNYFTEKKPKPVGKSGFAKPGKRFRF